MGKIRVKTIGDESQEKKEKQKAQKRAQAKKEIEEKKVSSENTESISTTEKTELKTESKETSSKTKLKTHQKNKKSQKHSGKYLTVAKLVEKNKKYTLSEALEILPKLKLAKFDETVELHINTNDKGISGNVTLPHGTGKELKIEILNFSKDPKHVDQAVKEIESGKINFDVLIATPDSMPRIARVAKFLGPRGLMPNPKNGTVTPKPEEVAKKFQGGQINFKTEAKFPILHLSVGKLSFGDKKLSDNIKACLSAVENKNIRNITIKSTMSPGIKLDNASII